MYLDEHFGAGYDNEAGGYGIVPPPPVPAPAGGDGGGGGGGGDGAIFAREGVEGANDAVGMNGGGEGGEGNRGDGVGGGPQGGAGVEKVVFSSGGKHAINKKKEDEHDHDQPQVRYDDKEDHKSSFKEDQLEDIMDDPELLRPKLVESLIQDGQNNVDVARLQLWDILHKREVEVEDKEVVGGKRKRLAFDVEAPLLVKALLDAMDKNDRKVVEDELIRRAEDEAKYVAEKLRAKEVTGSPDDFDERND
jgi:hypothetical protein